jgi:alkylation response protein AidB-like acyl-CoA dehydrogenase
MDFTLTDDHLALRDAVQRFCDGEYPAPDRGLPESPETAARRDAGLAELGLFGLPMAATFGGSEQGPVESMLVAQELGRALAGGRWLAQVPLAGQLIAELATPEQQGRWLPAIASGSLRVALACEEPQARYALDAIQAEARPDASGTRARLDGRKSGVLCGDDAQLLLVVARVQAGLAGSDAGNDNGCIAADQIAVYAVDGQADGLSRQPYRTLDGRTAAHLQLQGVQGERLGVADSAVGHALACLQRAVDRATAALCAEAAGAAEALLLLTTEHLRTRRQFGAPLAKFQALQHRVADQAIALEQIKSMACVAALALEADDADARARGVSAAKALVSQLARQAAFAGIQLHGAMGMTDECAAARYARRLIALGQQFGDAPFHLRRFASLRSEAHSWPT